MVMRKIVSVVLISMLFLACQQDDDTLSIQNKIVLEKVIGSLSSPSNKAIPNVLVFFDDNGTMYATKTNLSGNFELEVPVGQGELHFKTGRVNCSGLL